MTPQQFIDAALWFPETRETEPFGPGILVYKVREKVFALLMPGDTERPARISLKCDPGLALELRAQYPSVVPGYHLNKRHWNTVALDGTVPDDELAEMLRHSYERVVAGMRRADRDRLTAVLGDDLPPLPGNA
ncbi:MmcQ/YjbR family DNA-binding protein [Nocardiopsis suaedae]|uniref:MmcQ/YjbR family DNA-binding protein n=1 Tax=Nocardiopsis suaedae TaxID=3018444 RepID=A0ABT4TF22_9ACTN|nr:MmcQ/YjbR family DNA-binding protein [Nocardiopsis suaedae]MDA2803303.1 MmcQ/YjbR family DNA-binding protein [Nocardiopsis suaedae]